MLFHDPIFVFAFLPISLGLYLLLSREAPLWAAMAALAIASLIFYGWWEPRYEFLLIGSIVVNYLFGRAITAAPRRKRLLTLAVAANLLALGVFKYAGFLAEIASSVTGSIIEIERPTLPLGISFFTFLQIAYLVDAYRGQTHDRSFGRYFLFVTFFPHLIAGPIVHHSELMPQFKRRISAIWEHLSVGSVIFVIGLFKKLVLAAQMGTWTDAFFGAAAGASPGFVESWLGALCFAFQIYFDFSAYSDMAVGLSRMFGIWLPVNFNSPYKATGIIEFWRRWHITLSRFLREYLYFPLGGNRKGRLRSYVNIMVVMLLAGLWHGAAWKFVLWGGIHGIYLLINHGWRELTSRKRFARLRFPAPVAVAVTFAATVVAWVPFRASDLAQSLAMLRGMCGLNGITLPAHYLATLGRAGETLAAAGVHFGVVPGYGGGVQLMWLTALLVFVWALPNTQELLAPYHPALGFEASGANGQWRRVLAWRPDPRLAAAIGLVAAFLSLRVLQGRPGEFIYFQF